MGLLRSNRLAADIPTHFLRTRKQNHNVREKLRINAADLVGISPAIRGYSRKTRPPSLDDLEVRGLAREGDAEPAERGTPARKEDARPGRGTARTEILASSARISVLGGIPPRFGRQPARLGPEPTDSPRRSRPGANGFPAGVVPGSR